MATNNENSIFRYLTPKKNLNTNFKYGGTSILLVEEPKAYHSKDKMRHILNPPKFYNGAWGYNITSIPKINYGVNERNIKSMDLKKVPC